jgi:predicted nuclease of predicted toxin-antitoxin system
MRFLADESCDVAVVRALRHAGHDILAVAEEHPGAEDRVVIDLSCRSDRILLTEDKDFGQLVFATQRGTVGVLLLRYPAHARHRLARDVVTLVAARAEHLRGRFVVMQPGRVRIRVART